MPRSSCILQHHIAGEAPQILDAVGVLGRDDEPELMPVLAAAIEEVLAVGIVGVRSVEGAAAAVARRALALEIAQMRVRLATAKLQAGRSVP